MNNIATKDKKFFFEVEEGSNYKVRMTYDEEEIITFEQFQKLSMAIFQGQGDFVTINKRIVQKRDIRMIEPTKELTVKQKEEREERQYKIAQLQHRKDELERLKRNFKFDYMNKKYGVGKWVEYRFGLGNKDKQTTTNEDYIEINKLFDKQYPKEAQEIEKITKRVDEYSILPFNS